MLDFAHIFKSFGGKVTGARLERAQNSGHYAHGKFQNTIPTHKVRLYNVPRMFWKMLFGKEQRYPKRPIPLEYRSQNDFQSPQALRATWLGHASVIVEIDGHTILTDPVFSDRCSPSEKMGPKRFHAPPIQLSDLPEIDYVLISHDHYDHLDMDTVLELTRKNVKFIVPLGVGAHLEKWEVPAANFIETNWNESVTLGSLTITTTAARHFSGRTLLDGNKTFWASYVIAGLKHKVFYSGDSGYCPEYKSIGDTHGPFDLTLMQIGACSANWPDIHMYPEDALLAHQDLKGKLFLPVHWGTFNLAFHAWNDPAIRILAHAREKGVPVCIPVPGQIVDVLNPPDVNFWWQEP